MLAPMQNPDELATRYAADDRLRLDNVLSADVAEKVHASVAALPFDLIFHAGGSGRVAAADELERLSPAQRAQLSDEVSRQAAKGVGFLYAGYRMEGERLQAAPGLLRDLLASMNGELLERVREITGIKTLVQADGQYTRYEAGHFLTRHSDAVAAEHRRVAYVLNFSKAWHPDWGGLLQFYSPEGEPRDAWTPRFNSLALFDVRHIHAVTYVAPFAPSPRLALTGWFRDA